MNAILNHHEMQQSKAGNKYWKVTFQQRGLYLTINPRWKQAEHEAKAEGIKNKQPVWLLQSEYTESTANFDGTGAAWAMIRKSGKCYQGNFLLEGVTYLVDIKRNSPTSFELVLTSQDEVSIDDI